MDFLPSLETRLLFDDAFSLRFIFYIYFGRIVISITANMSGSAHVPIHRNEIATV